MPRISLLEMRRLNIFEAINQPEVVYHMTSRSNAKQILESGRVKVFDDYVCFFFDDPKWIPVYIAVFNLDNGYAYQGFDMKVHRKPPLDHSDTVILKLTPRKKESMAWYREVNNSLQTGLEEETQKKYDATVYASYKCRLCHYDDFSFRRDKAEVIELIDIDSSFPRITSQDDLSRFIEDNGLTEDMINYISACHTKSVPKA